MLKVDTYTKAVLTVIAVCLIVLAFGPLLNTPVEAAKYLKTSTGGETYERIRLEEEREKRLMRLRRGGGSRGGGVIDVNIQSVGGLSVCGSSLPVEIR
ncbi:MAG: hypothetical protein KAX15_06855 [Candidatus Omnitrophica bacterium]|nr:hypothetical protein [Candidatus Omnitrophota bacterium]